MIAFWILVSMGTGFALGAFYFGGLFITVRRLVEMQQPALLMVLSFVVRSAVVLLGFYLVANGQWERLAACLAGFLVARTLLIRILRFVEQPVLKVR